MYYLLDCTMELQKFHGDVDAENVETAQGSSKSADSGSSCAASAQGNHRTPRHALGANHTAAGCTSLDPLNIPRRIVVAHQNRKWEVRCTGTEGVEDDDDIYYVNLKTNETVWDKPADFDTASGKEAYEGIALDTDSDLADNLDAIGILSAASNKDAEDMRNGGDAEAEKRIFGRLQSLLKLLSECKFGSESEWKVLTNRNAFELPKTVASFLGKRTSADVRALVGANSFAFFLLLYLSLSL